VVADSETELQVLSKTKLRQMFLATGPPSLSTRFYKYIATLVAERLIHGNILQVNRIQSEISDSSTHSNKSPEDQMYVFSKLTSTFGLPKNEVLLHAYRAMIPRKRKIDLHGHIYLTSNFICFYANVFGSKTKVMIPYQRITSLEKKKHSDKRFIIEIKERFDVEHLFAFKYQEEDIYDKLVNFQHQATNNKDNSAELLSQEELTDEFSMTQEDWDLVLKNSQCISIKKDAVIVEEGKDCTIHQIGSGSIRVERVMDGKLTVIGRAGSGELFGEIAFLENIPSKVTVIAEEDTEVYVLSPGAELLQGTDFLATRFFKYLATVLAHRVIHTLSN